MASMMEIMQHCRLCLVKEQVNIPIFEEHGDIRQIFLKITACLPIKVEREDNLPKKICDGCLYKLDLLYEFWNTTSNAEKQLLSWLSAAGLESKAKIDDEIVVSPTQVVLKEEPITDIPNDIPNDITDDIPNDIPHDIPKDQDFMEEQPFKSMDFAYGDTKFQDTPETITTTELVPSEGEPEPKRPRRAAAAATAAAIAAADLANSESEEDVDDPADQTVTKTEDESEEEEDENEEDLDMAEVEPAFVDVSQEANPDAQPGPSGIGKAGDAQNKYICALCNKQFDTIDKLKLHGIYHREKTLACPYCSKMFRHNSEIERHLKVCLQNPEQVRECKFCGNLILSEAKFRWHVKMHENDSKHYCDICGRRFSTAYAATVHKESMHLGVRHPCPHCGKVFTTDNYLKTHMGIHDPSFKSPEYKCELCEYVVKTKRNYNRHMRRHAGEREEQFMCDICGKSITSKGSLDIHLSTHGNEKPFSCTICGKTFPCKRYMRIHERTHLNEKRYSCEICSKKFTQRSTAVIHMRQHTGNKPYKCDICEKSFASKALLKTHSKIHGKPLCT